MMRYKRCLEFDLVANFSLNFLIFIKIIPNLLDIKMEFILHFHRFFTSIKNFNTRNIKKNRNFFYFKITYRMKIFSTNDNARRIYFIRTEITYLFSRLFQL